ncbi:ferritin [Kibdelosporangium philippinense]|uniref:Ferritin n=1 Tax=Kibdelosporangium philippinense TaxID=211113 RepID=A0ABS8Z2G7_9PSEU|nr:ferritin [Kibdelosporangium philippinense]MCE7002131.1 ferritin [Kibdelosporangium philippinense]
MSPNATTSTFHELLQTQIRNEFTASQQYIALAVWFDDQDLPRLAALFYRQSVEERNHAMKIVQYFLDNDLPVAIPGADEVRNDFKSAHDLVALALHQEQEVTEQVTRLASAARDEGDYLGEQFMHWFLSEQVEEVARMNRLVHVVERAGENLFHVEDFLARESDGLAGRRDGSTGLPTAGGAVK